MSPREGPGHGPAPAIGLTYGRGIYINFISRHAADLLDDRFAIVRASARATNVGSTGGKDCDRVRQANLDQFSAPQRCMRAEIYASRGRARRAVHDEKTRCEEPHAGDPCQKQQATALKPPWHRSRHLNSTRVPERCP